MRTKRITFKFIPNDFSFYDLESSYKDDGYLPVSNPLPYENLPDGEYLIRGNQKEHRKEYWKDGDAWYLVDVVEKDNGHYICDSSAYMLFPSLPEKEWKRILAIPYKRFSPVWQRHIFGYKHWLELRRIKRDSGLMYRQFIKNAIPDFDCGFNIEGHG